MSPFPLSRFCINIINDNWGARLDLLACLSAICCGALGCGQAQREGLQERMPHILQVPLKRTAICKDCEFDYIRSCSSAQHNWSWKTSTFVKAMQPGNNLQQVFAKDPKPNQMISS